MIKKLNNILITNDDGCEAIGLKILLNNQKSKLPSEIIVSTGWGGFEVEWMEKLIKNEEKEAAKEA